MTYGFFGQHFFLWQKMQQSQSAEGEGYRQQKIEVAQIQQGELKKKKCFQICLVGWLNWYTQYAVH